MKTRVNPQKLQRNPVIQQIIRNPSRAIRRHEDKRMKTRALRKLQQWDADTVLLSREVLNRRIGMAATQHGTCDCWMRTTHDTHLQRKEHRDEARFFEFDVL